MSDHILHHYGKARPVRVSEPYALVPSRHSPMVRPAGSAAGEGLVLPPLTPEARALLEAWAKAQEPPPPPAPLVVEPVESTYYRLRREHRDRDK